MHLEQILSQEVEVRVLPLDRPAERIHAHVINYVAGGEHAARFDLALVNSNADSLRVQDGRFNDARLHEETRVLQVFRPASIKLHLVHLVRLVGLVLADLLDLDIRRAMVLRLMTRGRHFGLLVDNGRLIAQV